MSCHACRYGFVEFMNQRLAQASAKANQGLMINERVVTLRVQSAPSSGLSALPPAPVCLSAWHARDTHVNAVLSGVAGGSAALSEKASKSRRGKLSKQGESTAEGCFSCGQSGHRNRDCPNKYGAFGRAGGQGPPPPSKNFMTNFPTTGQPSSKRQIQNKRKFEDQITT